MHHYPICLKDKCLICVLHKCEQMWQISYLDHICPTFISFQICFFVQWFFAVIMQHANMAYHVQRAYKGSTIWLLSWGGGGGVVEVIWEKNIVKSDFEHKKVLQGNTCHTIALYCQGKAFYYQRFGEKNILTQTHEITHTLVKVKWPAPNYM